ncbi:MAG: ABC transporter ATP-binding protein [Gammaproteobacteria bacterium]
MRPLAIELDEVEFAWKGAKSTLAVRHMTVSRGERVFLQGASGSGKSTLLGLIGGVLTPRQGRIEVLGTPLGTMSGGDRDRFRAAHVGFIFQMFNLIPYLTVRANVLLPLGFSKERRQQLGDENADDEARRLLAALGLTDAGLIERPVTQLSIGQQQRVAAARALLGRPRIVIADEPTSSLDADARADFLHLLMSECAAHQTTLLFVSHDTALGSMFDRTLSMNDLNRALPRAA